jgi:CheY-like chemotaxis protein
VAGYLFPDTGSASSAGDQPNSIAEPSTEPATLVRAHPSASAAEESAAIVGIPILSVGERADHWKANRQANTEVRELDWELDSPEPGASPIEWADVEFAPATGRAASQDRTPDSSDSDYIEVDENELEPVSNRAASPMSKIDPADVELAALVRDLAIEESPLSTPEELGEADIEPASMEPEPPTVHRGVAAFEALLASDVETEAHVPELAATSTDLVDSEPSHAELSATESSLMDLEEPALSDAELEAELSELEQADTAAPRPSAAPRARAPVVMIVEDDASIRELVTRTLGTEYCVYEAPDGVVALNMLSRMSTPDLFLLDVRMPRMDGLALAGRVREDTRMRMVPIIFLTGLDSASDVVNGINAGARQYVTKPFKMKDLKRRVDRALSYRLL